MFEHEAALVAAGNQLALEWTKLEIAGVDPAELKVIPSESAEENYLPYIRARDRLLACVEACESAGVQISLRYRVWLSSGCSYNPGMHPPALAIACLFIVLVVIGLQAFGLIEVDKMSGGVLALLASVVAFSWDKVWAYANYLKLLKLTL